VASEDDAMYCIRIPHELQQPEQDLEKKKEKCLLGHHQTDNSRSGNGDINYGAVRDRMVPYKRDDFMYGAEMSHRHTLIVITGCN
jgi:hypothetical protein